MTATLVHAKHVVCKVSGPNSAHVISDAGIFQQDGEIKEIAGFDELRKKYPSLEIIGSSNCIAIPGLVNDHFHVGLSPFQLGVKDLPLELWSLTRIAARKVHPYLDHLYGAVQMIESGTTTVQVLRTIERGQRPVIVPDARAILKAYEQSGMRVSYGPSVVDRNSLVAGANGGEREFCCQLPPKTAEKFRSFIGKGYATVDRMVADLEEIYRLFGGERKKSVRIVMAPSNVHRCSDELLIALKRLSDKYNSGVHIHLQETIYQRQYALRTWGKTPLQHLDDLGLLDGSVTCGHGVWLTEADADIAARTGVTICHNPSSNLRVKSGIAPINLLMERGVRIALGTDEAGINDDKDMFQEMRLAFNLHRVPGIECRAPTAHEVFQMATENGAYAAGFGGETGTLEAGKRADIVLLDVENIERPYLHPDTSVVEGVVHRARAVDVDTVMIDGELVMRNRRLTRINKDHLYEQIDEELRRPAEADEQEQRVFVDEIEPYLRRFYEGLAFTAMPHYQYNEQ